MLLKNIIIISVFLGCLNCKAIGNHSLGSPNISDTQALKQELGFKLDYYKTKKSFYNNLSLCLKIGAGINFCCWAILFYTCVSQELPFEQLKWVSMNAKIANAGAITFFVLAKWLDVEAIPLEQQIIQDEGRLAFL